MSHTHTHPHHTPTPHTHTPHTPHTHHTPPLPSQVWQRPTLCLTRLCNILSCLVVHRRCFLRSGRGLGSPSTPPVTVWRPIGILEKVGLQKFISIIVINHYSKRTLYCSISCPVKFNIDPISTILWFSESLEIANSVISQIWTLI